jgi:hypothetical protein
MQDRLAIRELLENWVVWRDSGYWDQLETAWHDDGVMVATFFQGPAKEFIRLSKEGWTKGTVNIMHCQGAMSIDLSGNRAIAQTKMSICQRGRVHDVLCDITCMGRFYDFVEKRNNRWAIVLRQPIYEKDRIDPVDPAATVKLDSEKLAQMPKGCEHLMYMQAHFGFKPKLDMPYLRGSLVERLYACGKAWLAGGKLDW